MYELRAVFLLGLLSGVVSCDRFERVVVSYLGLSVYLRILLSFIVVCLRFFLITSTVGFCVYIDA